MKDVFISYRRGDTANEAQRISSAIETIITNKSHHEGQHCGRCFLDTQTIEPGDHWPDRLTNALESSTYILVLIGKQWLLCGMDQYGRRRIDNPEDWVRREIRFALQAKHKTVTPVLLQGSAMPPPDVLPKDIASITSRQAVTIRDGPYWEQDLQTRLLSRIDSPPVDGAKTNPVLQPIWNHMDEELQKTMSVAATLAKHADKNYISTTTFVQALMLLKPGQISDFFQQLPPGALPEEPQGPSSSSTTGTDNAFQSIDSFSPCINSAMANLPSEPSTILSAEDVYIDIARFAKGKSTQRLRLNGIEKSDVEKIVSQLGWQIIERKNEKE